MSIINDALKKVQKNLNTRVEETPAPQPTRPQAPTGYLYAAPPPPPVEPPIQKEPPGKAKPSVPQKINSLLALICAAMITIACFGFLFLQFKKNMPKFNRWVTTSYLKWAPKTSKSGFINKFARDLKPLAHLTINPPPTSKTAAPVTLDIHGVMANGTSNLVLINNEIYQEGDEVEGVKIVKIDMDVITVNNKGVEQTIRVGK